MIASPMSFDDFDRLRTRLARAEPSVVSARQRLAAAGLVVDGLAIGAGAPSPSAGATPVPAYAVEQTREGTDRWHAVNDRVTFEVHGAASMTHMDFVSHFAWSAAGAPAGEPGAAGASGARGASGAPAPHVDGVVGRGVLIDLPAFLGRELAAGEKAGADAVRGALERQGTSLRPGDTAWIRFGRARPRRADDTLDAPMPGLSLECADLLADAAAIVTDGGLDGSPSEVAGIPTPWHILVLTALRIPLVDLAELTRLSRACGAARRWEFLSVLAPAPLRDTSGAPLTPIAVL